MKWKSKASLSRKLSQKNGSVHANSGRGGTKAVKTVFTVLDAEDGFHQVKLDNESKFPPHNVVDPLWEISLPSYGTRNQQRP